MARISKVYYDHPRKAKPSRLVCERSISRGHMRYDSYAVRSWPDLVRRTLDVFTEEASDSLALLADVDEEHLTRNNHRKNRYVSREANLLFPDSPHLLSDLAYQKGGYWIANNQTSQQAEDVLSEACEALNIRKAYLDALRL